jgi:hypothetical protein
MSVRTLVSLEFGISGDDTYQTVTELNTVIPAEKLHQIEQVMSAKFRMSPKMLLHLAKMLSHDPESRHPRKRIVRWLFKRILHTLENPFELPTPPQHVEHHEDDLSPRWIDCPLTHPGLDHFTNAIEFNFVPFLRGDRSLSLPKILEILCILRHHLILAIEQMMSIRNDIDTGGQGSDALCSDVRYSTCGQERPFEEQQNYHAAKESIYVISDLLQRIEQVLPTFLEIFNLYVQMCSK